MNTLYYGDNLKILREYIKDESVDLVYLDPPFNSNRNYNVLFKDESGSEADSQITAFEDTWHWNASAEETYHELIMTGDDVAKMIESFRQFIGNNQMMAYLVMMAVRLKELHRVLKPTGSLYLHCDPTASHYLKILLDTIFGAQNYRNEIIWKRSAAHNDPNRFGNIHDVILYYRESSRAATRWNKLYTPYTPEYIDAEWQELPSGRFFKSENMLDPQNKMAEFDFMGTTARWRTNSEGMMELWDAPQTEVPNSHGRIKLRRDGTPRKRCRIMFLDEMPGVPLQSLWTDIPYIAGRAKEKLGYATQKPVALLERIISASSNEGDLVLDPFCGCGTTIAAAQKLNRRWIGIDITHLSVGLMKLRLKDSFGLVPERGRSRPQTPLAASDAAARSTLPVGDADAADKSVRVPSYQVIGQPEDLDGARELAANDRYGFQWWILPLIGAKAFGAEAGKKEGKKGADKGIDGSITFVDDNSGKAKRVIVSVKSGKPNVTHIRELSDVLASNNAAIGVYVTLEPPTRPMITEAVEKGFYHSPGWNRDYPRLQIITVEEILAGKQVDMPPTGITFRQAGKMGQAASDQQGFEFQ
ncbi:MAG TPA: DNA methyltransferase [Pyrinomonadaceae bacterium]|nr:DNA methyltransferase [Pyrinomonadaceae bacterium]